MGCSSSDDIPVNRIADVFVREYRACHRLPEFQTNEARTECARVRTRKVLRALGADSEGCLKDIAESWSRLAEGVAERRLDPQIADRQFKASIELIEAICRSTSQPSGKK